MKIWILYSNSSYPDSWLDIWIVHEVCDYDPRLMTDKYNDKKKWKVEEKFLMQRQLVFAS